MLSTTVYITVPLLLEALSRYLNQPYEKLQDYYQTSKAFRDYITSLTSDFESDIRDKIYKTTPSTTPRFDVPWILDQLKKKQQEIYNIKKQLAENEINIEQAQRAEYKKPPKNEQIYNPVINPSTGERAFKTKDKKKIEKLLQEEHKKKYGYTNKKEFLEKKAQDVKEGNLKTIALNKKLQNINDRPLRNTDPRYKSYTERIHNAQKHKKTDEK